MKISCPKCGQNYEVEDAVSGEKVECGVCSYKWFVPCMNKPILQEHFPDIMPPVSWNENFSRSAFTFHFRSEALDDINRRKSEQKYYNQQHQPPKDETAAYCELKKICSLESPPPALFREFFKLCRKKNTDDKRKRNWHDLKNRIEFMQKLNEKQIEMIWISMKFHSHISKKEIAAAYDKITVTDKKNLEKAKEMLKKNA